MYNGPSMKKALLILTLESPVAVSNAALYGAILEARKSSFIEGIYGAKRGLEGLLNDDIVDLEKEEKEEIEKLPFLPGSVLGTSSVNLSYNDCTGEMEAIRKVIDRLNIGYFLLLGGLKTAELALSLSTSFLLGGIEASVLSLPLSEENAVAMTDHSLGYPSAAMRLLSSVRSIVDVARSASGKKVYLLSVEDAASGYLSSSAFLLPAAARPDLIYPLESEASGEEVLTAIKEILASKGQAIVLADRGFLDRVHLDDLPFEAPLETIPLSYFHRVGPEGLSSLDVWEAESAARLAVLSFKNGESGKMASIVREKDAPYESSLTLVPLGQAVGTRRPFPKEWILSPSEGSDELRAYLSPLVSGEASAPSALPLKAAPNLLYKKV